MNYGTTGSFGSVYRILFTGSISAAKVVKYTSHRRMRTHLYVYARAHMCKHSCTRFLTPATQKVVDMAGIPPKEHEKIVRVFNAELKILMQVVPIF